MSLGTFTIIRNEAPWIAGHLLNLLPFVDEMVFFDGNSSDGTVEIIEAIRAEHPDGKKIKLHLGKDPLDLRDDYVRVSDECLHSLSTDLAWFAHPDFWVVDPSRILAVKDSTALAIKTRMRSFAGEPDGQLYEISEGRQEYWKNIYRLKNPDLGAHYHGHYGHHLEDVYFREVTGDSYENHAPYFDRFPYEVEDSGIEVLHFSDVRPKERRIERMVRCTLNQGFKPIKAAERAANHPRVTFQNGGGFKFTPAEYPAEMVAANNKYAHLRRTPAHV